MNKASVLFLAAALAASGAAPAFAKPRHQQVVRQSSSLPDLSGLLAAYPAGGQGLEEQAARQCQSCEGAQAIIAAARRANPDQKAAIAIGILRALRSAEANNRDLARCIRQAMLDADPTLTAMLRALEAQNYAQNRGYGRGEPVFYPGGGGFSTGSGGGGIIVSPH